MEKIGAYRRPRKKPVALIKLSVYFPLRELRPPGPGEDGEYEPETVQAFLDSLVDEIHISDDEFGLWDTPTAATGELQVTQHDIMHSHRLE